MKRLSLIATLCLFGFSAHAMDARQFCEEQIAETVTLEPSRAAMNFALMDMARDAMKEQVSDEWFPTVDEIVDWMKTDLARQSQPFGINAPVSLKRCLAITDLDAFLSRDDA